VLSWFSGQGEGQDLTAIVTAHLNPVGPVHPLSRKGCCTALASVCPTESELLYFL
jgi:epoxyqueuosine reductase QueG